MKKLLMTLAKAGIGALVGILLGTLIGEDIQFMCITCAGIAFGWKFANNIIGSIISTNFASSMVLLTIKLIIAVFIGWIIMIVEIVKGIICAIMEFRGISTAV